MVTNVYQYDPYGQVTLGSSDHTDFYGYNAESYNPNTGLEYLRARYYNAEEGRCFQEDMYLGNNMDPLTLNRYAYVKNSPLNYVDPSGHEPIEGEDFLWKSPHNTNSESQSLKEWFQKVSVKLVLETQKKTMSLVFGVLASVVEAGRALVYGPGHQLISGALNQKTVTESMREAASNEMAFEIGRVIGDVALIILGFSAIGLGWGSAAAITGLSGGTAITVAGAEAVALTYAGTTIMIEAAMDATDAVSRVTIQQMSGEASGGGESGEKGDSNSVKPTQEGLDTIKEYLSGDMQADFNDAMIDRIENTLKEESQRDPMLNFIVMNSKNHG